MVAVVTVFLLFFNQPLGGPKEIPISEVISLASNNTSTERLHIEVRGDSLTVTDGDQGIQSRSKEEGSSLVQLFNRGRRRPRQLFR